jgi:hypothetical protein
MILYYAMGGGLGHLTRACAVIHTLHIREPVTIVTASPFAYDSRIVGSARVQPVPAALATDLPMYRRWLQALIKHVRPHTMYLDAFPAGLLGEWCNLPLPDGIAVYHVARLLRWPIYRTRLAGPPPQFTTTYTVEPLAIDQETFLEQHSDQVRPLELADPPGQPGQIWHQTVSSLHRRGRPLWVVVHAGVDEEVLQLVSYAQETSRIEGVEPQLILIAPQRPAALPLHVAHYNHYPATPFFAMADRLITACGFNSMRLAAPYRSRHRFMPFPRRLDDQFRRAARYRRTPG